MKANVLKMQDTSDVDISRINEIKEMLHRQILDAVSHDLKTPLATMIGSLEIYRQMDGKLTEEKKKTLIATALTEAYRLDTFITNILDMAKLESGKIKIKPEPCNLTGILNDCITRLGPKRSLCEIKFSRLSEDVSVVVDVMLLSRAIIILIDNAIKYGGKHPIITIEYGVKNNKCLIHVRDLGPGIPAGKEKEIFSKYTRFNRADHQNAGTGLGLAICYQIMKMLKGQVKAKNHMDGGALFSISFPLLQANAL